MIFGIGTDILHRNTIARSVENPDEPFVKKTYTQKELSLILSREQPLYCYGTRFAGKEAVFKCFGINGNALRLNDIEILETPDGQPIVYLHGKAKELAASLGISDIKISLSYDGDFILAFAVAES